MIRPCRLIALCVAAATYIGHGEVEDTTDTDPTDPTPELS